MHNMGFILRDCVMGTNWTVLVCSMTSIQVCQLPNLCNNECTAVGFFTLLLIPVTCYPLLSLGPLYTLDGRSGHHEQFWVLWHIKTSMSQPEIRPWSISLQPVTVLSNPGFCNSFLNCLYLFKNSLLIFLHLLRHLFPHIINNMPSFMWTQSSRWSSC